MMSDLITVVVPVYNAEKNLAECIESILAQEYDNLEILLINDGSEDGSLAVCNAYAVKDKRITVIDKKNTGVSATRNLGISKARGRYIAFVDADDTIDKTMYKRLYQKAQESDADMTFCRFIEQRGGMALHVKEPALKRVAEQKDLVPLFLSKNNVMGSVWRILFKADLCKPLAFDEELKLEEDKLFVLNAIVKSAKATYVEDYLYRYAANENLSKYFSPRIFEERKSLYLKEQPFFCFIPSSVAKAEKYRIYLKTALSVLYNSDDYKNNMRELDSDPFFRDAKKWKYLKCYIANESLRDGVKAVFLKLGLYRVLKNRAHT